MRLLTPTFTAVLCGVALARAGGREAAPRHWSFQPVREPKPGESIDGFIDATLSARSLKPLSQALPEALLRRLHFNITGLPPTQNEQDSFHSDCASLWYSARSRKAAG
jgi:hypothetical protein